MSRTRFSLLLTALVALPVSALAQQPATPANPAPGFPSTRKPLPTVQNKEEQAAKAAAEAAAKCARYDSARNIVYAAAIKSVLPEMPQPGQGSDPAAMQQEVQTAYEKYEAEARTGDIGALRKMTAIEMFVGQLRKSNAGEPTLRKACTLAKLPDRQRVILDPLTCAVLSLEGNRREEEGARPRAKEMMELARKSIPEGANAAHAGKVLFDDVARGLDGCF